VPSPVVWVVRLREQLLARMPYRCGDYCSVYLCDRKKEKKMQTHLMQVTINTL
jgi:hypothetical protein